MFKNAQTGREMSAEMLERYRQFNRLADVRFPDKVMDVAQQMVDESFRKETYQDGKSARWKERKNDSESSKERTERRALLVKTGRLIKSTGAERRGNDIIIGSDTPYSERHNEGKKGTPRRQFMPAPGERNEKIDKTVEKWLDSEMDKIFG